MRQGGSAGTVGGIKSEVCLYALREARYFSFSLIWDTVGHRDIRTEGAQDVHERGTKGTREGHKRCTIGAQEVHEKCTRGAREVHERCTHGH